MPTVINFDNQVTGSKNDLINTIGSESSDLSKNQLKKLHIRFIGYTI